MVFLPRDGYIRDVSVSKYRASRKIVSLRSPTVAIGSSKTYIPQLPTYALHNLVLPIDSNGAARLEVMPNKTLG